MPALVVWTAGGVQNQGPTVGQPALKVPHIYMTERAAKDGCRALRCPLQSSAACAVNVYRAQSRFPKPDWAHYPAAR